MGYLCHLVDTDYSRTSRKRPPKLQRLSGRLQESNHTGSLPRRGPDQEQRDQRIRQVVAYERLKTMDNH